MVLVGNRCDLEDNAVVGMKEASRTQYVKHLWVYTKDNNLQDPENKQYFIFDKMWLSSHKVRKIQIFREIIVTYFCSLFCRV